MSPKLQTYRLPQGGLIDRTQPLRASFDGQEITGFAGDTLAAANARFHRIVIDAARSDHLAKLITLAMDAPLTLRIFGRYTPEEVGRSMRHHREVVDALAHRDPAWSASAMRTHILSAIGAARRTRIAPEAERPERAAVGSRG